MDNPLINIDLGKLSKPLTKLIDVVGKGVGTLYSPWGTVRQAKADAKAKIIIAKSGNDIAHLNIRAKSRLEYQESVRQHNIEQITVHAAKALPPQVSKKDVDKDWIFQFFNYAQDVCDEDMQILWGRILAGETSAPESFSKRTLHFLKTLSKMEAERFTEYCRFVFSFDDGWPFVILSYNCIGEMRDNFGGKDMVPHFMSIGLLNPMESGLIKGNELDRITIHYFNKSYMFFRHKKVEGRRSSLPRIRYMSQIGRELQSIAGAKPNEKFIDIMIKDMNNWRRDVSLSEVRIIKGTRNNSNKEK